MKICLYNPISIVMEKMLLFGLNAARHNVTFAKGKINPDDYDAVIFFNTAFYSKDFFQILNSKTYAFCKNNYRIKILS